MNRAPQFNPEALAARRQREMEQTKSLMHSSNTLPSATVTINKPENQWVCPACTFSNPGSAKQCVVCSTPKGQVVNMKVCRNRADLWKDTKRGNYWRR